MKKQTLYKLTTQDNKTRKGYTNECTWGPGVTHSGTGKGDLCGPGFIHAYTSPLLAIFLNPIHAAIDDPKLWECEGTVVKTDRDLKVGSISLTTVKEIPVPNITTNKKAAFGIYCALATGYGGRFWEFWANDWLAGKDKTFETAAARAAARAEWDADWADIRAADARAEWAAATRAINEAAARAEWADARVDAERAIRAAAGAAAVRAAEWAAEWAEVATAAGRVAGRVAWAASEATKAAKINLYECAEKAMKIE